MKALKFYLIVMSFVGISCEKLVDVGVPDSSIVFQTAFSDDKTATASINGLYALMLNNPQYFGSYGLTVYPALSADELVNTKSNNTVDQFVSNSLSPENSVLNNIWARAYNILFQSNACIEGLTEAQSLTDTLKNRLLGESKFIRAFTNYYLVNLFGDIPLITSTNYHTNRSIKRTSQNQVYLQIIEDLKAAELSLPESYITSTVPRGRVNKYCASALLARVFLHVNDWQQAELRATSVINSSLYSLTPIANVFKIQSNETLWQLDGTGLTYNTYLGNQLLPPNSSTKPSFVLTDNLLNAFEPTDQRKLSVNWVSKNTIGGVDYYYPSKYKVRTGSAITEATICLRLAEQFLIRAEARAQQDNIPGAVSDLNVVRQRAGLACLSPSITQAQTLLAVEQERRVELFSEFGHRWVDLKRSNRADEVLKSVKLSTWDAWDTLYPIPFSQIQLNGSLTQNNGY